MSVNVAAGSKVIFELTYEELLKRNKGKYEMYLKVQPKQLVRHFEVSSRSCVPCLEPQKAQRRAVGSGSGRRREELRAESRTLSPRPCTRLKWFESSTMALATTARS